MNGIRAPAVNSSVHDKFVILFTEMLTRGEIDDAVDESMSAKVVMKTPMQQRPSSSGKSRRPGLAVLGAIAALALAGWAAVYLFGSRQLASGYGDRGLLARRWSRRRAFSRDSSSL